MPFLRKIRIKSASVFVWEITETEQELFCENLLSDIDNKRFEKIKSDNHRRSFLAVRCLLQQIGIARENLFYDSNGKPFLTNGQHISVSHSYKYAVVAIASEKIGIDIEKIQNRIERLAYRFTHWQPNMEATQVEKISALTKIWTIKESLYKVANVTAVDFKKHLIINDFYPEKNEFLTRVQHPDCSEDYYTFCNEMEDFVWSLTILNVESNVKNQKICSTN